MVLPLLQRRLKQEMERDSFNTVDKLVFTLGVYSQLRLHQAMLFEENGFEVIALNGVQLHLEMLILLRILKLMS